MSSGPPPPLDVAVLKSPVYGTAGTAPLPYRIDLLEHHGMRLHWDDRRAALTGRGARLAGRVEGWTTPLLQAWQLRRAIAAAPVTLAMFESEGHGLALARMLGLQRRTMLVVISCWLADLAPRLGRVRLGLYRRLYRQVDLVTVFSANQVPILESYLGIPRARIEVVPFGVDTAELVALPRGDDGFLLAPGRDDARDWPTLFAAVAGTGRRVVVLARPSRLPTTPPPPEVEILGYVDRARYLDLLARCQGVLIVTREAAYPSGQTVLLEALALGKRCVVTDTTAMRSFAGDLPVTRVPVHDPVALRAAVDALAGADAPVVPRARLDAAQLWQAVGASITARVELRR